MALPEPVYVDPELVYDNDDYSEYWQVASKRLDAVAKVIYVHNGWAKHQLRYVLPRCCSLSAS